MSEENDPEATAGGDAPVDAAKNFTTYDFGATSHVPKEHTKTIQLIHENFATSAAMAIATQLNTDATLSVESVEQQMFQDCIEDFASPTCCALMEMLPLNGHAVINISPNIVFSYVDKKLGGSGEVPASGRPFTDLELALGQKFLQVLLKELDQAWIAVLKLNYTIKYMYTNPALIRLISARESCVVVTIKMTMLGTQGDINLCIPYVNLEPIAAKLGNDQWHSRHHGRQPEEIREAHQKNFSEISLDLTAILGRLELSMEDLLLLQPNDILDINRKARHPIELRIANQNKFKINPGLVGKSKAVSIMQEIVEE